MPLGHGSAMGDLYFEYEVVFPKTIELQSDDEKALKRLLGSEAKREVINTRTTSAPDDDVAMEDGEVTPEEVDLNEERQKWQDQLEQSKAKGQTEDDDERPGGATQCRAQ